MQQTYTEVSEVLIVVQSVADQKGIWYFKANVWNKYTDTTNVSRVKKTKHNLHFKCSASTTPQLLYI